MAGAVKASEAIKNRLKISEGLSLKPYQKVYASKTGKTYTDRVTIGYGNTYYENGITVKKGDPIISLVRAEQLFNNILKTFEALVNQEYSENLNQNQFDALLHYVYNVGNFAQKIGGHIDHSFQLATHSYLQRENTNKQLFDFWIQSRVKPGGVLVDDLVQRRQYEANLFLNTHLTAATVTKTSPLTDISTYTVQDKPKLQEASILNQDEQTFEDFLKLHHINMTPIELLGYSNNSISIFKPYTDKQKAANNNKVTVNLIPKGAKVTFPLNKSDGRSIYTLLNQTIIYNTDYNAFIEREIRKLINNPNYQKLNSNNSDLKYGSLFKRQDALSVWIWCKSTDDGSGRLIDITNYVENISTNVTKDGGNFSVTLPNLNYIRTGIDFQINVKRYKDQGVNNFISKNISHQLGTENQLTLLVDKAKNADQSLRDSVNDIGISGKYWKKNKSYFSALIQNNDLIFIKLEKIGSDKNRDQNIHNEVDDYISSKNLSGGIFDLIGLIDTCQETSTAENANMGNVIHGRDFSKLLIDDGTYFFPVEYAAKNSEEIIKNSTKRKSGRRLIINSNPKLNDKNRQNYNYTADGGLTPDLQFNFDKTQSIKEWITFIFSQLTNIQICPDSVFSGYADKTFIVTSNNLDENTPNITYKTIQANGVWIIVKLVLDDSICNRRIADTSLVTDTGSLINLIKKVCPEPFVELSMDTYGDKWYCMIRKPPFSLESFKTNKCINIFEDDILNSSLDFSNEVYTWYKINPYNSIFGNDDNGSFLTLFPAIMLPEYMDIWGSKVLEVTSNFIDFDSAVSEQSETNLNLIYNQALEDLDWLIETNAYLPFTRMGSFTIKSDRRIKRGMNIRNYGTGEIFYVDSVAQNRACGETIDGSTTLSVSRGMVEEHLEKYFKIVKLRKYSSDPNMRKGNQPSTGDVWSVDLEMFNFFLKRLQNN